MKASIDIVIREIREIFEIDKNKGSNEKDGKFQINKNQMTKIAVIKKLKRYFDVVTIEDGFVIMHISTPTHIVFGIYENIHF